MDRPYKLPRRRKFRVLTGFIEEFGFLAGSKTELIYSTVNANSPDDAVSQCETVALFCGEAIVEEIT